MHFIYKLQPTVVGSGVIYKLYQMILVYCELFTVAAPIKLTHAHDAVVPAF